MFLDTYLDPETIFIRLKSIADVKNFHDDVLKTKEELDKNES